MSCNSRVVIVEQARTDDEYDIIEWICKVGIQL